MQKHRKYENKTTSLLQNPTISQKQNNSEVDEISDEEFKKMILRIINEIKEDINI
jgi:hypothetical protein